MQQLQLNSKSKNELFGKFFFQIDSVFSIFEFTWKNLLRKVKEIKISLLRHFRIQFLIFILN